MLVLYCGVLCFVFDQLINEWISRRSVCARMCVCECECVVNRRE